MGLLERFIVLKTYDANRVTSNFMRRPAPPCPPVRWRVSPSRRWLLVGVLSTCGLAAACGATSEAPCASDSACVATRSCDDGVCVDPARIRVPDLRARRVAIEAQDDATVVSSTCCTTAAFGSHDVLVVGGSSAGGAYRSYLSFDLTEIEDGEVARATLQLTASDRWCAGGEPLEVLVFAAGRSWSEGSLTWLGQPGASGGPLGRAYLRPDHVAATTIDVTELVTAWARGSIPNTGMLLRARQERRDSRVAWYSAEALDEGARPQLEVHVR